jgi:hypothetical protein
MMIEAIAMFAAGYAVRHFQTYLIAYIRKWADK